MENCKICNYNDSTIISLKGNTYCMLCLHKIQINISNRRYEITSSNIFYNSSLETLKLLILLEYKIPDNIYYILVKYNQLTTLKFLNTIQSYKIPEYIVDNIYINSIYEPPSFSKTKYLVDIAIEFNNLDILEFLNTLNLKRQ